MSYLSEFADSPRDGITCFLQVMQEIRNTSTTKAAARTRLLQDSPASTHPYTPVFLKFLNTPARDNNRNVLDFLKKHPLIVDMLVEGRNLVAPHPDVSCFFTLEPVGSTQAGIVVKLLEGFLRQHGLDAAPDVVQPMAKVGYLLQRCFWECVGEKPEANLHRHATRAILLHARLFTPEGRAQFLTSDLSVSEVLDSLTETRLTGLPSRVLMEVPNPYKGGLGMRGSWMMQIAASRLYSTKTSAQYVERMFECVTVDEAVELAESVNSQR